MLGSTPRAKEIKKAPAAEATRAIFTGTLLMMRCGWRMRNRRRGREHNWQRRKRIIDAFDLLHFGATRDIDRHLSRGCFYHGMEKRNNAEIARHIRVYGYLISIHVLDVNGFKRSHRGSLSGKLGSRCGRDMRGRRRRNVLHLGGGDRGHANNSRGNLHNR
jgi:hypothetical protein